MKKLFTLFSIFFILVSVVGAQESADTPENIAAKYNVSFPIAELGGCEDYSSCRTYCEDPVNKTTCTAYAQAKGFYQQDDLSSRQQEILDVAKSELGCSDRNSCEAVCHLKENFDKCSTFAQKHNIQGGHTVDPAKQEIITKAREVLGCDSENTCRAICEQEVNRDKCSAFARDTGLRGGEMRRGPGGCTSEQTCNTYCTDPTHFNECSQYGERRGPDGFSGPGGCNSEQSCRDYCQKNPNACHFSEQQEQKRGEIEQCFGSGKFWYNDTCNDKPMSEYFQRVSNPKIEECFRSGKFWDGKECRDRSEVEQQYQERRAQEYGEFCRQNPDKCKPGQTADFTDSEERSGFENFCTKYPDRCRNVEVYGGTPPPGGPADTQPRCGGGSYWNGSSCTPYTGPNSGTANCTSGQYWNGTSCVSSTNNQSCPSGIYQNGACADQLKKTPEQICVENPGCRWENGTCNCGSGSGGNPGLQSPEQQCAQGGRCWKDGSCYDCGSNVSGNSGPTVAAPTSMQSSGTGGGECEASGGHWENGGCVHGETTQSSLIQKILGYFSRLFGLAY